MELIMYENAVFGFKQFHHECICISRDISAKCPMLYLPILVSPVIMNAIKVLKMFKSVFFSIICSICFCFVLSGSSQSWFNINLISVGPSISKRHRGIPSNRKGNLCFLRYYSICKLFFFLILYDLRKEAGGEW